jgi:hypothetical protein
MRGDAAGDGEPAVAGRASQGQRSQIGGGALPGVRAGEGEEGTRAAPAGPVDPALGPRSGARVGRPDGRPRPAS